MRRRVFGVFRAYPVRALAGSVFAATLVGILANATVLQRGHHPAPLFAPKPGLEQSAGKVASVPVPASRPTDPLPAPSRPEATPAAGSPDGSQPHASGHPLPPGGEDGIARLLGEGAPSRETTGRTPARDDGVAAAQRALVKLGYSVKPDGFAGPATRQALQAFGRERHIAVDKGITPKMLRALNAAAGLPPG